MLMEQFINELDLTFPNNPCIRLYKTNFENIKKTNPRLILDRFMDKVKPLSDYIVNKNPEMFELDTGIVKELKLKELWISGINETTKDAIWSHLNTLYVFGSTLSILPPNMMSSIEALAQQCAQNMDTDQINDPMELMKGMQNMLMK
jgi:hypothetical protein